MVSPVRTDAASRVNSVVERLASAYMAGTGPRAILLVGSATTGEVDGFSDIDVILYYDVAPAVAHLERVAARLGAERYTGTDYPGEGYGERFWLDGIHCQLGHALIDAWEREIEKVVDDLDLDQRLVKQLMGLLEGKALHGSELIERWRVRAAYTPRLQRAMIERYWSFFPWWHYEDKLMLRDATIWRYDVLVQSAYNLLGVIAALNRVYYSTFELKRVQSYLTQFAIAPAGLYDRLEGLFTAKPRDATAELERLIEETRTLVMDSFPDLRLPLEWAGNPTPPGSRETPWA